MTWLELWRMLEVPDWSFMNWNLFRGDHNSTMLFYPKFGVSGIKSEVQKTPLYNDDMTGVVEAAGGSWLEYHDLKFI